MKAIPVGIAGIAVFAIIQVIYTIMTYDEILTSFPLWMSVVSEIVFWSIPILIGIIIYVLLKKHKK